MQMAESTAAAPAVPVADPTDPTSDDMLEALRVRPSPASCAGSPFKGGGWVLVRVVLRLLVGTMQFRLTPTHRGSLAELAKKSGVYVS